MTENDLPPGPAPEQTGGGRVPEHADPVEWERLTHALTVRFAPHVEAATAAVRDAEQDLARARDALARAHHDAAHQSYQSDRLVFMRAGVEDEADGLTRKTTAKKVRVAYRYLADRAVELAEAEVAGFHDDQAAARRQREQGVAACETAERVALDRLDAARAMLSRVRDAEQAAHRGLAVMLEKLATPDERASA